jgi:predicted transcriptional regulator
MGRPKATAPTTAEMRCLVELWKKDNHTGTVRDIHDATPKHAYTSIATIVRIMVEKDYVEIFDKRRPQRFRAKVGPELAVETVQCFIQEAFGGDAATVAAAVAKIQGITPAAPAKKGKR